MRTVFTPDKISDLGHPGQEAMPLSELIMKVAPGAECDETGLSAPSCVVEPGIHYIAAGLRHIAAGLGHLAAGLRRTDRGAGGSGVAEVRFLATVTPAWSAR